ncbi:hypothetical protein MLD38_012415 [Melastoma candidum]|uniref:Uncharacterized protein n=1 Tax=Melastoma candidum TaxID=119954 RepID=A0ACB9RAE9_9MYRT|nr:hypothetical protein MLD38_012415 [Melastoma candidum]
MIMAFFRVLVLSSLVSLASGFGMVGVNYGQLGNDLPPPAESVRLVRTKLNAWHIKIYDANPGILAALNGTGLRVTIMVPNGVIDAISKDQSFADRWVRSNVRPFYPGTMIRHVLVGNEVISSTGKATWLNLVPAMYRMRRALVRNSMWKVMVGTTLSMDMLSSSYPPSSGSFRPDIVEPVMAPMLRFLRQTKSFLFLDVYPYFAWAADPTHIHLDYALFASDNITVVDPGTGLVYRNLFDQMVDAVIFASAKLGYPDVRIYIAETGWPNSGDYNQIGANINNAATYNRNAIKKFNAHPPIGTPARPGLSLPSFIFALYNENQKPGPGTERHFGLLYPDGSSIYDVDLSGKTSQSDYAKKPPPKPEPHKGKKIWCVAAKTREVDRAALEAALSYACSQGEGTCDAIQPGNPCFEGQPLAQIASYAFSSYWAKFSGVGATCRFDGVATQTTKDPSYGRCEFPSVTL